MKGVQTDAFICERKEKRLEMCNSVCVLCRVLHSFTFLSLCCAFSLKPETSDSPAGGASPARHRAADRPITHAGNCLSAGGDAVRGAAFGSTPQQHFLLLCWTGWLWGAWAPVRRSQQGKVATHPAALPE